MTTQDSQAALRRATLFFAIALCGGIVGLSTLAMLHSNRPDDASSRIFFRLTMYGEPVSLLLLAAFGVLAALYWQRSALGPRGTWEPNGSWLARLSNPVTLPLIAGLLALGAVALFRAESFSMDEYGAVFQARLFAMGEVAAHTPTEWRSHAAGIAPEFIDLRPSDSAWVSPYLPGNALLRAPFERLGIGWLTGVLMAIAAIALLARIAKELWPGERTRQAAVVVSMVLSMQFVLTAGTPYAMTAHLTLNLLWLWLWIGTDNRAMWAGPVGLVAFMLHQHVPHALFVAPFLVRALTTGQFKRVVWMGSWYLLALFASAQWHTFVGHVAGTGNLSSAFAAPGFLSFIVLALNVMLLLTWQTPLASIGFVVAVAQWRRLKALEQDLLLGVALSLVAFLFFALITQGHGWGWRYGHQVLGNVALMTGVAWPTLAAAFSPALFRRLVIVSLALTMLIQIPLRAAVAYAFEAPFARTHAYLRAQDADILLIPTDSVWYGRDLLRNPIGLPRPILVREPYSSRIGVDHLPGAAGGVVKRVTVQELVNLGLERIKPLPPDAH